MAEKNYSSEEDEDLEELMSVDPASIQSTTPAAQQVVQSLPTDQPAPQGPPAYMVDPYGLGEITSVGNQPVQAAPVPVAAPVAPPAAVPTTAPTPAPRVAPRPAPQAAAPAQAATPAAPNPGAPMSAEDYTTASVENLDQQADIARQQADLAQQTADDLYTKRNQAAEESLQQAADYKNFFDQLMVKHEEDAKRTQAAYNEYSAKAGSLKDPTNQYYDDHGGFAGRLAAGVAAFASGLGAGLLGHAGNPFLDFLNNHIAQNFEAHKQNIRDIYEKQVAAGKIADTNQNWAMFSREARLKAYELDAAHIEHELQSIKDRAVGQQAKLTAEIGIKGLEQQKIEKRRELAKEQAAILAKKQAEARAAANAAAAAREARAKELRGVISEAYKVALGKDMPTDQAAQAAFMAGKATGASNLELAAAAENIGAAYNPRTEQFEVPVVQAPGKGGAANLSENEKKIDGIADSALRDSATMAQLGGLRRDPKTATPDHPEGKWVPGDAWIGTENWVGSDKAGFNSAARSLATSMVMLAQRGGSPEKSLIDENASAYDTMSQKKLAAEMNQAELTARQEKRNIEKLKNPSTNTPQTSQEKPKDDAGKVKKIMFTKG